MDVTNDFPCSLLVEDPFFKREAIRYIRGLKRDSHSVESHLLLEKLGHATPSELPAHMWEESFKIWEKFFKAEPYKNFKEKLLGGGCVLEDVPRFLFFHVGNPDVGELYADLDPRMYLENATMLLDNVEDCPVQFPSENMPALRGLAICNASYYSFRGALPPTLEVLMIENGVYPEARINMNELLEGLGRLKILIVENCSITGQIDNIESLVPSLEAIVCRGPTNDCTCQEQVYSLLPNMLGILPAKNSSWSYTAWVGHVYYRDPSILSEICEVSLLERYQKRLEHLRERDVEFKEEEGN
uniref:F-box/LRR-repeat protein At3g03360-like n=1 Tax=Strongyloides venezuelensis TaxID=75913 RepID=A0A0K0FT37_STRVS